MRYVTRTQWGAPAWATTLASVPWTARTELVVHWHGGAPAVDRGPDVPRTIDRMHRDRGWAGVGYSWIVDQDGTVYEGRGWTTIGAHATGHNASGIGVLVSVGEGGPPPAPAALAAVREIADEADARAGRRLRRLGHRDLMATECPGDTLHAWIHAGMPIEEDTMALSDADVTRIWHAAWPDGRGGTIRAEDRLAAAAHAAALEEQVAVLAGEVKALRAGLEQLLAALPSGGGR